MQERGLPSVAKFIIAFPPGVFYYFNSILNPILYSVMSKRFRRAFLDLKMTFIPAGCCNMAESWPK